MALIVGEADQPPTLPTGGGFTPTQGQGQVFMQSATDAQLWNIQQPRDVRRLRRCSRLGVAFTPRAASH